MNNSHRHNVLDRTELKDIKHTNEKILIPDSGATHHMDVDKSLFEDIEYYSKHSRPQVMLGNEKTYCAVHGFGYLKFIANKKIIRLHALYIPNLGNSTLLSIKQNISAGKVVHSMLKTIRQYLRIQPSYSTF